MNAPECLSEWTQQLIIAGKVVEERRLRAVIQPRPRWLPERVWRRVLRRLLVIEEQRR